MLRSPTFYNKDGDNNKDDDNDDDNRLLLISFFIVHSSFSFNWKWLIGIFFLSILYFGIL